MDVKLENLIEKIKKEGVEGGRKASEEMIQKAALDADGMIKKAKREAEGIVKEAEKEAARFRKNAELAVKQAARDSELLLKEKVTQLLDSLLKGEIIRALSPDVMKELIVKMIGKWSGKEGVEIVLSEKDRKQLKDVILTSLKKEIKETVTIQVSQDIAHGFRIGLKGKNIYYDFSDESISEMLKLFLNPDIQEILEGNG